MHVFVFGAGASHHTGAPLTNQLLFKGFELLCKDTCEEVSIKSFRSIATFIDALYGSTLSISIEQLMRDDHVFLRKDWFPFVTLEELFTFTDLGILSGQNWIPTFKDLQEAMYDFIFETLDYKTDGSVSVQFHGDGTFSRNPQTSYDTLLDNIIDINKKTCFITFNYDLFLDRACFINQQQTFGNYNLNFDVVEHIPDYVDKTTNASDETDGRLIDILKLHGSLNWARCATCERRYLTFARKYRQYDRTFCQNCSEALRPILVPPTLRKRIYDLGLKAVWERAHECLKNADSITIIGYSFPEADVEAKWLFKKAVAEGCRNPELTLVDPCAQVRDKILGLFGKTAKYKAYFDNFEKYCHEIRA